MQGRQDADALLPRHAARFREDQLLVRDVQIARRLVEYQHAGLLRQRPGDGDLLPFAAGQLLDAAVRQVFQLHLPQDAAGHRAVLFAGLQAEI